MDRKPRNPKQAIAGAHTRNRVFQFVLDFHNLHGYSPSFAEIVAGAGLKTTSHAQKVVRQLATEGRLTYTPGIARSILPTNRETAHNLRVS